MEAAVTEASEPRERGRTCVGCGEKATVDATDMLRLVLGPDGSVVVDSGGKKGGATLSGRGAHVHPAPECLKRAARGGLSRSFKRSIETTPAALEEACAFALERRAFGLLLAARRTNTIVFGSDAVNQNLSETADINNSSSLVIVATDAAAATRAPRVAAAIAGGHAVAWGTKDSWGRFFDRGDVGVALVTSASLARAIGETLRAWQRCRPQAQTQTSGSREVR